MVRLAEAAAAADDPCSAQLQGGPLRLSALAKRLGRDPQARLARLRREGVVDVEQDLDAPGLPRGARGRAGAGAGVEPRGSAQAEVLERLRAAGRPRARGRPACATARPCAAPSTGWWSRARVRLVDGARRAGARGAAGARRRRRSCRPRTRSARSRPLLEALVGGRASSRSCSTASPAAARPRSTSAPSSAALARGRGAILSWCPRSRLTPMLVRAARGALRRHGLGAAQRALGGRAPRPVVAHPRGRGARRGRGALGGVRADAGARAHRGRRGARGGLQAGREPALPRPRRGGDAGAPRGRAGGAGLGDAVARVATRTRCRASTRGCALPRAHRRPRACRGSRSWTAAPCCEAGRRADPDAAAARGARGCGSRGGAGAAAPEPPRLRDEPAVPRVRPAGGCARTARSRSRSTDGGRRALCHYCGHDVQTPAACAVLPRRLPAAQGFGTEKVVEAVAGRVPEARVDAARPRPAPPPRRRGADASPRSRRARSTSWWARR